MKKPIKQTKGKTKISPNCLFIYVPSKRIRITKGKRTHHIYSVENFTKSAAAKNAWSYLALGFPIRLGSV